VYFIPFSESLALLSNAQSSLQTPLYPHSSVERQYHQASSGLFSTRSTARREETFVGLSQEVQRARANQGSRLFDSNSTIRTQNTSNIPIQNTTNMFNNNPSRFDSHTSQPSPFNNNPSRFGEHARQSIFTNSVQNTFQVYRFASGADPQRQSILPNRENIVNIL